MHHAAIYKRTIIVKNNQEMVTDTVNKHQSKMGQYVVHISIILAFTLM